jgi:HKD family nuclease
LLRLQTPEQPAEVRNAIVDILDAHIRDVRIASAYVTLGGSEILFGCLSEYLPQDRIDKIPKTLITCLDFGITEPEALQHWGSLPNTNVRVAGAGMLASGSLFPAQAFHPKVYAFGLRGAHANIVVGSANMTIRGFTINTEAVWIEKNVSANRVDAVFSSASAGTAPLTDDLISAYKALRRRRPPPPQLKLETRPVPRPKPVVSGRLRTFRDAVESGALRPENFREMWVQSERMQGGSGNQLELPRRGHRFFGFVFTDYGFPDKKTIGVPTLRAGVRSWADRLVTWHGNNGMERFNLPTRSQGGFAYKDSAILFRRLDDGSFELIVAPWDSDLARSWREASAQKGTLFRTGGTSRLVGLI